MIREREQVYRSAFYLADLIATIVAFGLALRVRAVLPERVRLPVLGELPPLADFSAFVPAVMALTGIWLFLLFLFETSDFRAPPRTFALRYAKVTGVGSVLLLGCAFLLQWDFFPRTLIVLFALIDWASMFVSRIVMLRVAELIRRRRTGGHQILLVGTGPAAREVYEAIGEERSFGFEVMGLLRETTASPSPDWGDQPVFGDMSRLQEVLTRQVVDTVMFALEDTDEEALGDAIAVCEERGARVSIAMFPFRHVSPRMTLENLEGIPMLTFAQTPTNEVKLLFKRSIDVGVAALAILLLSPLMLATLLAIRLESKGAALYRQVRVGKMGRQFNVYKFRSMVVDAEERREALTEANEMGEGPMFKLKRDPRVTRVGRVIRKLSIDELPQLFNVLRGEMSLVGPRPSLPDEVARFEPWQRRRLSMKPGITCIWQVSGRNKIGFDDWMKLDLEYIDNWSIWLDIKILAKTVPVVLLGYGAS